MQLLTLEEDFLEKKGALLTAREIAGQPDLWDDVAGLFFRMRHDSARFLTEACGAADSIVLTGAGTSAFIGLSLAGPFFRNTGLTTLAVPTTDIVSHPHNYFDENHTPLVISFARSGNSPESCAALELADKLCGKCFHLIVTCDAGGALARYQSRNKTHIVVLPEASNDKSLAMTGSYSAMLLTGLMLAYIDEPQFIKAQLELLKKAARNILSEAVQMKKFAATGFTRAVFLGSGSLYGTATEAALKLQELTDGKVICKTESYLGLRHGPKAVIDDHTLVVYFFSNNDYVRQYEHDLVSTMKTGNNALFELGISERPETCYELDGQIHYGVDGLTIAEDFLPVCAIIAGQMLGFYKSLELGLMPDEPSVAGAISRVVQGVTIYPLDTGAPMVHQGE